MPFTLPSGHVVHGVCIRKTAPQGEFTVEVESIGNEFQSDQDGQTLRREEVKNMGFS